MTEEGNNRVGMGGNTVSPHEPVNVIFDLDRFFTQPAIESAYSRSWTMHVSPSGHSNDRRLSFNIPPMSDGNLYLLKDAKLALTVRLVDKDGNKPADDAKVSISNNLGQTLFKDIHMTMNECPCSLGYAGLYAHFCYMYNFLNASTDRKNGLLQLQGFASDNFADLDSASARHWGPVGQQSGFNTRRNMFGNYDKTRAKFTFDGEPRLFFSPLMTDFTNCEQPILSGVTIRLEMTRNRDTATVQNGDIVLNNTTSNTAFKAKGYKISVDKVELLIPVRTLNASLNLKIEQKLKEKPLNYNTIRTEVKKISLEKGHRTFVIDNLKTPQQSILPDRIYLALIADYYFDSDIGRNPFTYSSVLFEDPAKVATGTEPKTTKLIQTRLSVNNESLETFEGTGDAHAHCARKLLDLYSTLGFTETEAGLPIPIQQYMYKDFIIGYDITASKNAALLGADIRGRALDGAMRLDMTFSDVLPTNAWLLVLSEYHSSLSITHNRNVKYSYFA